MPDTEQELSSVYGLSSAVPPRASPEAVDLIQSNRIYPLEGVNPLKLREARTLYTDDRA